MYKTQTKKKKAFTLVELIIVITILAILSSIAFISFQNYTKDTRDSVRLTDIKQIYNGLDIKRIQTQTTPSPENGIEITNGTKILTKQGYAGTTILKQIKINNGGQDPLTKGYYTYTTDPQNKKIQLMTYLETTNKEVKILGKLEELIKQANATTNSGYYQDKHIYVYGDKIGILTDKNKVPLQETTTSTGIDLTTNTQELTTYFGGDIYDKGTSTKTGTTLINQIEGVQRGTVPCNETNYNGHTITSLQDKQTGNFTKTLTGIENGTGTGEIEATCNNGILNYTEKPNTLNCTIGYVPNTEGTNCVENKCSGIFPDNAEENGTQELGGTWNYSESTGVCKFKCQEGYTYDLGNNKCSINKYTISGTITNGNGGTINLCGTSTNIDSNGNFSLPNIDYGTNCSGITITKDSHNCSITTDGPSSLSVDVIDVNGICSSNNYFIGAGTSTDPYRLNGVVSNATSTLAINCNYYNLNATTNNGGNLRGNGTCGDGTKGCLSDGVYLIDPDGSGGNNAFQAYCDMNNNRGGWTLFSVGRVNTTTSSWNYPNQTSILTPLDTSVEKSLLITLGDSLVISSSNIVRYDFSDGGNIFYKETTPKYWWQGSSYYTTNMSGGYAGSDAIIESGNAYCSTNYTNVLNNSWTGPLTIGNITCGAPNYATKHLASGGGYCDGSCPSCRMFLRNSTMFHVPPCYASGNVVRRWIK